MVVKRRSSKYLAQMKWCKLWTHRWNYGWNEPSRTEPVWPKWTSLFGWVLSNAPMTGILCDLGLGNFQRSLCSYVMKSTNGIGPNSRAFAQWMVDGMVKAKKSIQRRWDGCLGKQGSFDQKTPTKWLASIGKEVFTIYYLRWVTGSR